MPISLYCNFYFGGPQSAHSWVMVHCAETYSSSTIAFIRASQNHERSIMKRKLGGSVILCELQTILLLSYLLYIHIKNRKNDKVSALKHDCHFCHSDN